MCLRNMNRKRGLLNGTKLVVKDIKLNVIHTEILTGSAKGEHVLLPRIDFAPKDHPDIAFTLRQQQFPLKLSFAMTINKSQEQTLDKVGIFFYQSLFFHMVNYTRHFHESDVRVMSKFKLLTDLLKENSLKVLKKYLLAMLCCVKEIFDE